MPTRPPVHRPAHIKPRAQAERDRKAAQRRTVDWSAYNGAWRRVRLAVLAREPLCRACSEAGRVTAAEEVDHIDGNNRNNAAANLRPLCKPCHSRRTALDQGFARRAGGIKS